MGRMLRFSFVLWMFLFLSSNTIAKEFSSPEGFHLNIPEHWIEIPKEVLQAYSESVSALAPEAEKQIYDYAFQIDDSQNWLEYPYILIQVKNTGRIPQSALRKVKNIETKMEEGAAQVEDHFSAVLSQLKVGETLYDEAAHILWSTISANVEGVGPVNGLAALILTQRGTINVYGYSLAQEFPHYRQLFQNFARSVLLAKSLRYKTRLTDSLPGSGTIHWGRVFEKAVVGAIVGAIFGLVAALFGKRKKKESS